MIPVAEALARIFALVSPLPAETVPLARAHGRVLAADVVARRAQPPFDGSAMDGYALRSADASPGAELKIVGQSAAGHGFSGAISPGEAVRIFTGAPLPAGADRVVIQEDTTRDGDIVRLGPDLGSTRHVMPLGSDFAVGDLVAAPRRLGPADLALLAAMNIAAVPVTRRPVVAILATGDELVMPGETPGPDQIVASNGFGLAALAEAAGATARLLPIARDRLDSLAAALALARGADLIVTTGGASVGDHDLLGRAAGDLGVVLDFHKVAIRPGKPLMAGRLGATPMIGLPGHPVSCLVCGTVFMGPAIAVLSGLPAAPAPRRPARLATALEPNGPREHYMRARATGDEVRAFDRQASSLISVLADANCLLLRPPHDPARAAGEIVEILPL